MGGPDGADGSPSMNEIDVLAWFLALAPLSLSPGPANVLYAASGGAFGIRRTLPFLLGTNLVCIVQTALVGYGVAAVVTESASVQAALRWIGILVLLYLALRSFGSKKAVPGREPRPLSFGEGALVELFNAKFLLIPVMMFSLFYHPEKSDVWTVPALTVALAAMTLSANLVWVAGGRAAVAALEKGRFARHQGKFFGTVLLLTALWLAMA